MKRPIGYFVHHQGRGHAERCAALAHALPADRPLTVFCARQDIFPALPSRASLVALPSLFEEVAVPPDALASAPTPRSMHCVPLGWPTITHAVARLSTWFDEAAPALFVVDVSAELAQLARIASVPAVHILQHGDRSDVGHTAAYESCVGLLAPYDARLEQPERPAWLRARTHYAPGLGACLRLPDRAMARQVLGLEPSREVVLVMAGGGGSGAPLAPLTLGARAMPDALWLAIGPVSREGHETLPGNLQLSGWTHDPATYIAAADVVIAATGNTTVQTLLAAGKPYIAIPEWRYFDEQGRKGRALARIKAAHVLRHWPATSQAWRRAVGAARRIASTDQRTLVRHDAATTAAAWLEDLAERLWSPPSMNTEAPKAA